MCTKGLRFGRALKIVKEYKESKPRSIWVIYYTIGHDYSKSLGQTLARYALYLKPHKLKKLKGEVNDCKIRSGNIGTYVKIISANCEGNY